MRPLSTLVVPFVVVALVGCSRQPENKAGDASPPAAGSAASTAAASKPSVETAAKPSDACGWVPATDVEKIVGPLAGPPKAQGSDCVYPLTGKSAFFEKMAEARRTFNNNRDSSDLQNVVTIGVDLKGEVASELAMSGMGRMFGQMLGQKPTSAKAAREKLPAGWDYATTVPYTWIGRVGHVQISVFSPPEVAEDKKIAVANLVRDRIPDKPFPAENTYQVIDLGGKGKDPCSLLPRSEAEAVLGKLVVDPYRAVEDSSLAYSDGKACAFLTAGHHAFVLTPIWSDGETDFKMEKGIGGLVGQVLPQENPLLEGPWDKATLSMTGALLLLKGDRLLRVEYLTSSTDRAGALKLAAQAMPRLAQ